MKSPELVCWWEQSQPGACCTRFESEAGIRIDLRADRSAQVFLRRCFVSEIFQSLRFFSCFPEKDCRQTQRENNVQHGLDNGKGRRRGRLEGRDDALLHGAHILSGNGPTAR